MMSGKDRGRGRRGRGRGRGRGREGSSRTADKRPGRQEAAATTAPEPSVVVGRSAHSKEESQTGYQPALVTDDQADKPTETGEWSVAGKGKRSDKNKGGGDVMKESGRRPGEGDPTHKRASQDSDVPSDARSQGPKCGGRAIGKGPAQQQSQGQSVGLVGAQPKVRETSHLAPSDSLASCEGSLLQSKSAAVSEVTSGGIGTAAISRLPPRPGLGRRGRPIRLLTNFFKLDIPPDLTLYHYDVVIIPYAPRAIKRRVMEAVVQQYGKVFLHQFPVFDGEKNVYCHKKIESRQVRISVTIEDGGRKRQFEVEIKDTGHIVQCGDIEKVIGDPAQRMDILSALDLVLRQGTVLKPDVVSVGQAFFTPTRSTTASLGDGREVWFGYRQTARPSMWKTVLLNIDIAAKVFYKNQPVLDFLKDILVDMQGGGRNDRGGRGGGRGGRGGGGRRQDRAVPGGVEVPQWLDDHQKMKFLKEIKGLKIVVTHLPYPRQYKVNGLTSKTASKQTFILTEDGKEVERTVERYFADTYNKKLDYPNLPCLHVAAKNKTVYLPMECCWIAKGQRCIKKLTEMQLRNMIRHTAKPAEQRRQDILRHVYSAEFHHDSVLSEYGIKVHEDMEKVMGRVLPPPAIQYKEQEVVPKSGAWNMEHRQFCKGVEIRYLVVAVCAPNRSPSSEEDILDFMAKLSRLSDSLGMKIAAPCDVVFKPRMKATMPFLEEIVLKHKKLELIVVILPKKGADSGYAAVKHAGDNILGVRTQCIVAKTLEKKDFSTLTNVCLKINAKLGGTNSTISKSFLLGKEKKPVIVMGADVTHPAPGSDKPSIAALVASMDVHATLYRAATSIQKCRQEIITDMKKMVKGMLIAFWNNNNGAKPEHILFYRDGVSEGQFQQVLEKELKQLQEACEEVEHDYRPPITFVVVQKRHHTRLFPVDAKDSIGRSGNVPAGTTVDSGITHPTDHDFYLCSHAGIMGTSKPCHYYVLHDDKGYSADELQDVTFQLCHLFPRCNRSVSYPAPAYCAHLAAFRARYLLQAQEERDGASSVCSGASGGLSHEEMVEAIKINKEIEKTGMYFA